MKLTLKVYKEKGTYVGVLPAGIKSYPGVKKVKGPADRRLGPFRAALKKAQLQGFRKKEIIQQVQDEFLNEYNELLTVTSQSLPYGASVPVGSVIVLTVLRLDFED